ncbi:MAG: hypothetical protein ACOYM2_08990 [Rectinemataceae bacterium]
MVQDRYNAVPDMSTTTAYAPDFLIPPGEILEETLEARSIA